MSLAGKIAVVTGAGRGIGRAICLELADQGATVFGAARTASALAETEREIDARGIGRFIGVTADVTLEANVLRLFATVAATGPADILVNNAGAGNAASLLELSLEDWRRHMAVNADATFLCTREAARQMAPRGSGDIINLSSMAGKRAAPGFAAYTAAKFAAVGFTEAVARELRKTGIRVSSLCPGAVATELRRGIAPGEDASRITQPADIAALVGLIAAGTLRDLSLDIF